MYNLVEQIESRYITQLESDHERELYNRIPRKIRQDILIRKLNCKPYGRRKTMIRWGSPDVKSSGFVCFSNMDADSLELTVLPTPAPTDPDAAWYTEQGLRDVIQDPAIRSKIVLYKKPDGTRIRLRFKHLTWDEAAQILQPVVLWSRKNQNALKAAGAKPKTNSVGVNEFEMLVLVLHKLGGSGTVAQIAEGYANLFGFTLTDDITDGVKVALFQHSSDSDQYIGARDLFKQQADGSWALRG